MELFILSYSVHSLSLFPQQSWARDDSRVIEVLMILSGSNSALVGSISTSALTYLPQQLWAGQVVANRGAGTWDIPQHLGWDCRAEFWLWVEVSLWKTSYLHVLGAFLALSRELTGLEDTMCWCVTQHCKFIRSLFHKELQKIEQRYRNTWWSTLEVSFCDRKNNLLAVERIF